jgi:alpha-mannosidase
VYGIDLPAGTTVVKLPDNQKVRVLAMSVTQENPEVKTAQPLYDVLPSSQNISNGSIYRPSEKSLASQVQR